ncbi:MAG: hypothetical protein ACT4OZ_07360 [Gemmatimonadota bacterium]
MKMDLDRRAFLTSLGGGLVGAVAAGSLSSCGKGTATAPRQDTGDVAGQVLDLQGVPQGGFGQLILMFADGRQVGPRITPDASGRFRFGDLPPAPYQVRFHASGQAIVPEPYQHPFKFDIEANRTTTLNVRIQRGSFSQNLVEIYCGDGFFQLMPDGIENGETVVRQGTVVCWYNVGREVHTVTGGPWNDSGDLQKTQSFIWVANQAGIFPYRCRYNSPQMQGTLRVTA